MDGGDCDLFVFSGNGITVSYIFVIISRYCIVVLPVFGILTFSELVEFNFAESTNVFMKR